MTEQGVDLYAILRELWSRQEMIHRQIEAVRAVMRIAEVGMDTLPDLPFARSGPPAQMEPGKSMDEGPPLVRIGAKEIRKRCAEHISQARRPLDRGELFARLCEDGVSPGGNNPRNYLGTLMNQWDAYINIKRHGYWPRERDFRPGGYKAAAGGSDDASRPNAAAPRRSPGTLEVRTRA